MSGWRYFSAIFQNPNSALETVDLRGNAIDDDVMVSFASSLDNNSNLKELLYEGGNRITTAGWDAFSNTLCNKSSINATYDSNHTLQKIFEYCDGESDSVEEESQSLIELETLLVLNRDNTKVGAARRKIRDVHFSGAFNMQPFIDMD